MLCAVRYVREEHMSTAWDVWEETPTCKMCARDVRKETPRHNLRKPNLICTALGKHKLPKPKRNEFAPLMNELTQAVGGSKFAMSKETAHQVRLNRCLSINDIVEPELMTAPNYCHQKEEMSKDHVHK